MVKRTKELWVRTANAIAFILTVCAAFRWGFPTTMWVLPFGAFFRFSLRAWGEGLAPDAPRRSRIVVARRRIPSHADH